MCGHQPRPPPPPPPPPRAAPNYEVVDEGTKVFDFHADSVHPPTAGLNVGVTAILIIVTLLIAFCFRHRLARCFCGGFGYAHQQLTPYAAPYYPPAYPHVQHPDMKYVAGNNGFLQPVDVRFAGDPGAAQVRFIAAPRPPAAGPVRQIHEVPPSPTGHDAPMQLGAVAATAAATPSKIKI